MRWIPLILLATLPLVAADKPVPTKDVAAKCKVPKGFNVTLFAGEPDIVQPIAFTFDDRGRMWVVECLMYPKWSQDGKNGKDRVVILEDTDGDGKHDKKTVVLDGGVNLSGIELGFGGMYLCSSPNLIFIPLEGDRPGKPEILLDGWNIKDAKHNVFNSLIWGPDGWLYGCNGIQTKSKVGTPGTPEKDRIPFDCGVWKFHPTRKIFEVVATGTTNPWGLDFDEHGEMFITNCVIDHLFHVVPGGRYTRMYGQDYNPHTYGYMGSAVDYKHWGGGAWTDSRANQKTGELKKEHDDAGGGHAHSGAAIYLGDNFPKEYRNTLFTANIHGNRLNNDGLERTKTGMKGVRRPDFFFANDPWFRGICVKQGPAGELFVSDWCDTGECHNYDVADTTNGRIYRVTYGDLKPFKGDVRRMIIDDLVEAQLSPNEWLVRRARLELQRRADDPKQAARIADAIAALAWDQDKPIVRNYERRVWSLAAVGGLTKERYAALKKDDHSNGWLLRMGVEAGLEMAFGDLFSALRGETATATPLQLVSACRHLPIDLMLKGGYAELVRGMAEVDDPNTQLALWYAVEPLVAAHPTPLMQGVGGVKIPILRRNIVRRFLAVPNADLIAFRHVLQENHGKPALKDILLGILDHYTDNPADKPIPKWADLGLHTGVALKADVSELADEIGVRFRDETALKTMRERILDKAKDGRVKAIQLLAGIKTPDLDADLRKVLSDPVVRAAAIRALAYYADDATPSKILEIYPKLSAEEKADAVITLSSRKSYADALLEAVTKGTVAKGDISAFNARQIATLNDKALSQKLGKVWGEVNAATGAGKASIEKYRAILKPDFVAAGDAGKGRVLFAKNCGTCHKLHGEGQAVGPELTGSQRAVLDYILENVCTPNAVVPNEYKMTQFFLLDGRSVAGLVKKETKDSVTVRTLNEDATIAKADIDQRKATPLSLMPEGLFDPLKPEEVRDLVKYLQSKEQVPLSK